MLLAAVLIHALHAALEDREVALDRVRVHVTAPEWMIEAIVNDFHGGGPTYDEVAAAVVFHSDLTAIGLEMAVMLRYDDN